MSEATAARLVAMIAATYPTPGWEPATLAIYRDKLVDLDEAATTRVVDAWISTHDERPTIAAIRREVAKAQAASVGETFLPPDEAWAYVKSCFGSVGQYREFPSTHALVKRAVDGMGWVEMCRSENEDVIRGQFRMAYTALLERSITEVAASEGAALLPQILRPQIGMH